MSSIALYEVAHARTGDKGNCSNISVFAYQLEDYDWLVEQVTVERVIAHFASRHPTKVVRYLLPKLGAIHFVLDGILDGGVNDTLNLDMHGKGLSFYLLAMQIDSK